MKKLFHEVLHFGLIGVFNTILGYVLIMVFYNVLHWNYWVASATSYVIGSFISYFGNKKLTFKVEEHNWKIVFRFALNIAVCYLAAYGVARPLVRTLLADYSEVIAEKIGMAPVTLEENVAILFGTGMFIVLNFIGQKFFVFRKKEEQKSEE